MKKRKYIYLTLLCLAAMFLCMSSGETVSAGDYPEGVTLVRFNLHKSVNKEVGAPAGIPGYFTYYYQGREYHYGFRFDKNGEGVESKAFGTAYVWAPYTLIHYDALAGSFRSDKVEKERVASSTAYLGNVALKNIRGDGKKLGNVGNEEQHTNRFATDYTIYGNSLALSEGRMPKPVRKGYEFKGWYIETTNGVLDAQQTERLAFKKEFGTLKSRLNTEIKEGTKLLQQKNQVDKPLAELTLYAKWEKEAY